MHTRRMVTAVVVVLTGVTTLTVRAETTKVSEGLVAGASYDGLYRVEGSVLGEVWVKPDLVFDGRYEMILVDDEVPISYKNTPRSSSTTSRSRSRSANFALTENQKAEMELMFYETLIEALENTENLVLTDTAGSDVLLIRAELVDLVIRIPTTPSTGRSSFYVDEVGDVTMVLELRNSQTNEIYIRTVERRAMQTVGVGGPRMFSPTSAKSDVRRLFSNWAKFVAERLELIKQTVLDAAVE